MNNKLNYFEIPVKILALKCANHISENLLIRINNCLSSDPFSMNSQRIKSILLNKQNIEFNVHIL